jgi:GNAT superfamily N-acetyltransferase
MANLPAYSIQVYGNEDEMPQEAEELLREELADSRKPLPQDRPDREQWRFRSICATTAEGRVLGCVHLDLGPRNFGPLAADRIGFVEHGFVRPEHRRLGLGTRLLQKAIDVAREERCQSMRCNVSWENAGELALFKKCGFALACIEDGQYFAAKPLQGYGCNA